MRERPDASSSTAGTVTVDEGRRQHTLADWLALHQLDAATCRRLLDEIASTPRHKPLAHPEPGSAYQSLDLDTAWQRVVEAMVDFLPDWRDVIEDTFGKTDRILVGRGETKRMAVTIDNGPAAYPTILYSYCGEPADLLVAAHEFGHALQIRASGGKFVPPIMRETCAFLAEEALLLHARQRHETEYPHLANAWIRNTKRYFGIQSDRLRTDLADADVPYSYSWNYPIARYFAAQLSGRCSRAWIWRAFAGEISVECALQELACSSPVSLF